MQRPASRDGSGRAGSRMLRLAGPALLAALLAGCVAPEPLRSTAIQGPPVVPASTVAVGDRWTFNLVNGYNGEVVARQEVEVTGRTAEELQVRRTDLDRETQTDERYTADWNWLARARPGLQELEYSPAFRALPFPLEIGRIWQAETIAVDRAGQTRFPVRIHGRVLGWERIRVPAGEFDTVKVGRTVYQVDATYWQGNTRIDEVEWYAPAVGQVVRYENTSGHYDPNYVVRGQVVWIKGAWNVLELAQFRRGAPLQ